MAFSETSARGARLAAYIDGYNLYCGIRDSRWKFLYWIDPAAMVAAVVPHADLVAVKYFTARVRAPKDKRDRQTRYLDAVRVRGGTTIIYGKFYNKPRKCLACGNEWRSFEEKMTDSAIAANLVADAFLDRFDTALMVGGDTDIVPAIRIVRTHFSGKTILVAFPPKRKNQAVADICHGDDTINKAHLTAALMPRSVEVAPGVVVSRPPEWS